MALNSQRIIEAITRSLPILAVIPKDLEETLNRMLPEEGGKIDRERLNIILSAWKLQPINREFFRYYFGDTIDSVERFLDGMHLFIRDALWHFGDIRRGYAILSRAEDIRKFISSQQFDLKEFHARLPWALVQEITPSDRGFLGYVSGQRPYKQKEILSMTEKVLKELELNQDKWSKLTPEQLQDNLLQNISQDELRRIRELEQISNCQDIDLFSFSELKSNLDLIEKTKREVEQTIKKVEQLKQIGLANQIHYLRNIEMIDVYVATSMRDDKEYVEMADFVSIVFSHSEVAPLNLRYFDPTLCYCDSRIDKGIIECLLVRTAKITIYCAQDGDTFGKDSELAATLCQGKPVIVFVPTDIEDRERGERLDKRADIFRQFHPLGLQVGLYDGVARGVIVVRSPEQCARILSKILSNTLDVKVHFEDHGVVMREEETNSVLRTMTGWAELSHAFWSNFGININAKSGLCS